MPPKSYGRFQATHFKVGGTTPNSISEYQAEYIPRVGDAEDVNAETVRNLRKSHFSLTQNGRTAPINISETRAEFIPRKGGKVEQTVDLHAIKDNIILGKQGNDYMSTSAQEFVPRDTCDAEPYNPTLQASHFNLGEKKNSHFQTNYNSTFKGYPEEDFPDTKLCNYQKSSIHVAEGHQNRYLTEQMSEFVPRDASSHETHDLTRFQSTNFRVGDNRVQYPLSATQEALSQTKGASAQRESFQSLHLLQDNISALGAKEFGGQSETQAEYRPKDHLIAASPIAPNNGSSKDRVCPPNFEKPGDRTSEFNASYVPRSHQYSDEDAAKIKEFMNHATDPSCLKQSLVRNQYKSANQQDYNTSRLKYDDKDAEVAYNKLRHKTNNIQMRYEPTLPGHSTQTQDQLNQSRLVENDANVHEIDNKLRQSHIVITASKRGQYGTEYNDNYIVRGDATRSLNDEQLNDLRRSHHTIGKDFGYYQTEMQTEYVPIDHNKLED